MATEEIGECSSIKNRPENIKICRSMEEFGEEIQKATLKDNNVLMVICFVAKWSDKCKNMETFIDDLAVKEKEVVFITADIDDMQALAWDWHVGAVPTYVLLKREYALQRVYGYSKKALADTITKWKRLDVFERPPRRDPFQRVGEIGPPPISRRNRNEPVEEIGPLFDES